MMVCHSSFIVILHFLIIVTTAQEYRVSFTFNSYINPGNGSVSDPTCCDRGFISQFCYVPCENMFSICLANSGPIPQDRGDEAFCSIADTVSSGIIASDDIEFDTAVGDQPNPVTFNLDEIPEDGMRAYILIQDDDLGGFDEDGFTNEVDLIDEIFITLPQIVGTVVQARTYPGIHGIASLTLEYSLECFQDNYYGQDCTVFCEPQDSNIKGHYTCDRLTGSKVCLPGYQGANCIGLLSGLAALTTTTTIPQKIGQTAVTMTTSPMATTIAGGRNRIVAGTSTTISIDTAAGAIVTPSVTSQTSLSNSYLMRGSSITSSTLQVTIEQSGGSVTATLSTVHTTQTSMLATMSSLPEAEGASSGPIGLGMIAGIVGAVALLVMVALMLLVFTSCMYWRRNGWITKRTTDSADQSQIEDIGNPMYTVNSAPTSTPSSSSYQPLQSHKTTKNFYMSLDPQSKEEGNPPAPDTRDRCKGSFGSIGSYEVIKTKVGQDYASLYETPIDGVMAKEDTFVTVKANTVTEYREPVDSIATPQGEGLVAANVIGQQQPGAAMYETPCDGKMYETPCDGSTKYETPCVMDVATSKPSSDKQPHFYHVLTT